LTIAHGEPLVSTMLGKSSSLIDTFASVPNASTSGSLSTGVPRRWNSVRVC
jgi:hypothetical protein